MKRLKKSGEWILFGFFYYAPKTVYFSPLGKYILAKTLIKSTEINIIIVRKKWCYVNYATDIYYLIRKNLHNAATAKGVMGKLYSLVGILEVTGNDCLEALASPISDYDDAVVEKVASRKGMDYIVTHNIKGYQSGNMKIILPDAFIKRMEEE